MTGLGSGLPLFVALGFLVLGPKRMHAMLGQLARTKAEFDKASRGLKSQLTAELSGEPPATSKNHDKPRRGRLPDSYARKIPPLVGPEVRLPLAAIVAENSCWQLFNLVQVAVGYKHTLDDSALKAGSLDPRRLAECGA